MGSDAGCHTSLSQLHTAIYRNMENPFELTGLELLDKKNGTFHELLFNCKIIEKALAKT